MHALCFYQGSDSYSALGDFAEVATAYNSGHFMVEGYNLDNYNVKNQIFTVDSADKFKGIDAWVKQINAEGRSLVVGLIEAVTNDSDAYTQLMAHNSLLMQDKATVIFNQLKSAYVAYPDWFSDKTATYYATGLKDVETILSAFQGINLADNTNFGDCDYSCMPKTEGQTSVLEMLTTLREKRFLFEDAQPANEEEVGNYESYKVLPDQKTQSLVDMPF